MLDKNDKGEYALYDNGKLVGYSATERIDTARVIVSVAPIIKLMKAEAKAEGINLTLASGLRTWGEQMQLRKQNVIDKTKVNDEQYLTTADSGQFKPRTGKPGYSNHQDGKAYDFNVTGFPEVYKWLVANALNYGFIRTVVSERWHFEHWPTVKNQFAYVPKNDPSWDGLV